MISYEEMLGQLLGAARFGMDFGLGRVEATLGRLGNPERRLGRVAHVGGTNGKGSTAAMIDAMARSAGWRTGLYTSPHLLRVTERIRIDGREVEPEALARRFARMKAVAPEGLTFFEQLTVMAFMTFAEEGVDAAVLEVGLGGRLDATNVVDADVAVVTGVALDHEEVLGPGILSIAREKAGIFKAGRAAVIGDGGEPEAVPVLEAEAAARGARMRRVPCELPPDLRPSLMGAHQWCNAACALAAAEELGIPEEARRAGVRGARWPGRLEMVVEGVLVDAAHNVQAARALARALEDERRPLVLVVGVSAGKDAAGILAPLAGRAQAIIATQAPSQRALPAAEVAAHAPGAAVEPDVGRALVRAREAAGAGGLVVVFGSIFLVGAVRALLLGEAMDPVVLADPGKVAPR